MSETTSKIVTYEVLDQTGLDVSKLVTYIVIDPAVVASKLVTYLVLDPSTATASAFAAVMA